MKLNKLIVVITNKKGDAYQVALTDEERAMITDLIAQLHGGKIKATETKLPITIGINK